MIHNLQLLTIVVQLNHQLQNPLSHQLQKKQELIILRLPKQFELRDLGGNQL